MADADESMVEQVGAAMHAGDAGDVPAEDEIIATIPFDAAFDERRQRISEHRIAAQKQPDTMIACLAGVNSDLLDTELIVAETLRQGLAAGGGSFETIERHQPLIDMVLRFSKQISQLAQLEQRARRDNGEGTCSKPR